MSGWFAVARASFNHPLFKREPVTEWEAFMRLVGRAAHADTRHRVGGELLPVQRGSFFCTLRDLQLEFMWRSDARVRKFLERLENERMIERKTNAKKTHVSICNYDDYQQSARKENSKRTQPGTQDERTKEQENNIRGGTREEFNTFWEAYPHRGGAKKGKTHARKNFEVAVQSGIASDVIVSAASRFHQDRQVIRGFSPNPATWLNQRRWEDEIEPAKPHLSAISGGKDAPRKSDRLQRIISAAAAGTSGEDWPESGVDSESVLARGRHTGRNPGDGHGELDGPPAKPVSSGDQGSVAILPAGPEEPHGHWSPTQAGPGAAGADCLGPQTEAKGGFQRVYSMVSAAGQGVQGACQGNLRRAGVYAPEDFS